MQGGIGSRPAIFWITAVSAVLMVIGGFGPWATALGVTLTLAVTGTCLLLAAVIRDHSIRVNDAFIAARQAADKARRAGILTGFVTAASLILSFGAAWWAALKGGQHRDNSVPARFEFGPHRRRVAT